MKEIFKKIIAEWWETPIPELVERDFPSKSTEDIVAIVGPRRVGKTYLMYQWITHLLNNVDKEEILFIDFEDNRLAGLKTEELDELFVAHKEISAKELKYLFLDEIQNLPLWSKFLRRLHNTKRYHLVISGSSSKLLNREIATELRGRYKTIFLTPFSFSEFLNLREYKYDPMSEYSEKRGEVLRYFEEYLTQGGYPEIVKEAELTEKRERIHRYYETIFYKDLVERHKITNYDVMELLMNYLINNCASSFSITKFVALLKEKGLAVSKKQISLFLKYLEESFFIYALEEFSYSVKRRMMRPKKTYLIDNSFFTHLAVQFTPEKGKLLENLVLGQLKRKHSEVFFHNGTHECDFLVKENLKIVQAIQVCYELNEKNKERELRGLGEAIETYGLSEGLVLTYDQEKIIEKEGYKIILLPVWKWLLQVS